MEFPKTISGVDFSRYDSESDIILAINNDFEMIYMNRSWFAFAQNNQGEPDISKQFNLGSNMLHAISGELQKFYKDHLKKTLEDAELWQHEYECSSDTEFRSFLMTAYPAKDGTGILITHRLRVTSEIKDTEREYHPFDVKSYIDSKGFLEQCSNCRAYKNHQVTNRWDWVTDWEELKGVNTSHSICPICFDYYWSK